MVIAMMIIAFKNPMALSFEIDSRRIGRWKNVLLFFFCDFDLLVENEWEDLWVYKMVLGEKLTPRKW